MKINYKKLLWVFVAFLMVLSLVMASCGEKEVGEKEVEKTPEKEVTVTPVDKVEEKVVVVPGNDDKPQYGGTLTTARVADPTNWDAAGKAMGGGPTGQGVTYEQYVGADWTRGPAGSGVTNFASGAVAIEDNLMPMLAESWTIPEQGVWVLKIRKGVHWQPVDSPAGRLMKGREVTADDIVWSFNRGLQSPNAWINISQKAVSQASSAEKTGDWEVTIKTPIDYLTSFTWLVQGAGFNVLWPKEVVEEYGNVSDWRNAVGTGPWMVDDYVTGSLISFKKNPNYWGTNPVGPGKGDQLPYADAWKQMIIPDWSTRLAGVRTGKLDLLLNITKDDYDSLIRTAPELHTNKYLSNLPFLFAMRQDNPDLPYSDIRVRQALMYATDFEALKKDFYDGDAEILVYPVNKNFNDAYMPLDELPADVRDLYNYNPDKAKTMLAEAGYPEGFKVTVVVENIAARIDEVSIYKDMWAKVGVELNLRTLETGAYTGITARRDFDEMLYRFNWSAFPMIFYFSSTRGPSINNPSRINDPIGSDQVIEDAFQAINSAVFVDNTKVYSEFKKMYSHMVRQTYVIPRPTPYTYNVWWPWLKNYYGQPVDDNYFTQYYSIDKTLKKSMGY